MHTRGLPAPAKGQQAIDILQRMVDLSQPFGTKIEIAGAIAMVSVKPGK
jgi:hypothetical protein